MGSAVLEFGDSSLTKQREGHILAKLFLGNDLTIKISKAY
jgi:hypothetical protein